MIKFQLKILFFSFNLFLIVVVSNDANINVRREKVNESGLILNEGSGLGDNEASVYVSSRSDDEDVPLAVEKNIQSSGDGQAQPAKVHPRIDPYTMTRSTATILVDVAFEHSYEPYMLPGYPVTSKLKTFQKDIIKNLKIELQNIDGIFQHTILSFRPGPLIGKKNNTAAIIHVPSVFVRMNITERNSSFVNPIIIFHMSECGRRGYFGNLTISDQVIFPQFVCANNQVYCWPYCRIGTYCDGISDCSDTNLDETASCPKCLHKLINLVVNKEVLNEDEELSFNCKFNNKCNDFKKSIRWHFPPLLKIYEKFYNGVDRIDLLPKNLITSGIYTCSIDGESSSANVSVIRKPKVYLTKGNEDSEIIIVTEIEGQRIDYWCNATGGIAIWLPGNTAGVKISNYNETCSKISFNEITKGMSNVYYCQVLWGYQENKIIKKSIKIIVLCDAKYHFECKTQSKKRSCIQIEQKCDKIKQCEDGSDEENCDFCSEKDLSVDIGTNIIADVGDTIIMECLTTKATCTPLSWWSNGRIITTTGNIALFKSTLFIVNLRSYNRGVYQCSGNNSTTFIDVTVRINEAPKLKVWPLSRIVNITFGQSTSVNCSVEYPTFVTYKLIQPYWMKDNKNKFPKDVEIISKGGSLSTLSINNAQFLMTGVYTCEVTWGVVNEKVTSVPIQIYINPLICGKSKKVCKDNKMCLDDHLWCDGKKQCQDGSDENLCDLCKNGYVFVQPSNIVAFVGQTIELYCYYDKSCFPVNWRIGGHEYSSNNVAGLNTENNKLVINDVNLSSSNIYECYSGSQKSQSNVSVIEKIRLKLSSSYIFVNYGKDINIDCESNYGKPQWRRRDLKPFSDIKGIHQSHPNSNLAILSIRSSSYDATGYYMCFVRLSKSEEDAANGVTFVHVNDLKCLRDHLMCDEKTKCIPKSKICDLHMDCKDGFDEVNCSRCSGDILIKPKELIVTKFGYGVFQCEVSSKECLPIKWKFKFGNRLKEPRFYKFDTSLYIFSPKTNDGGEITCMNGHKSSSALLIVKDLLLTFEPNQTDDSTIYMFRGQSRKILCRSNLGSPSWIYPDAKSVSAFGVRYRNHKANVSVLDIVNIQVGASRKYVCYVMFSRESKKISLSIKVI